MKTEELKMLENEYQALRAEYRELTDKRNDNVAKKKAMRAKIKELKQCKSK